VDLITKADDERLVDGDAVPARHVALYRDSLRAALGERGKLESVCDQWKGLHKITCASLDTALAQLAEKEKQLESISCGPRLDPSRCSGCNGTGRKDCICGGKGTVEAERDGYKVAALNQLLKPPVTCAGCGSKEHRTDGCPDNPTSKEEL